MDFEIKHKDGMGRIGIIETPHGTITTPTIMPVINPKHQTLPLPKMKELGVECVITNSYIIYTHPELREKVLKDGVHKHINFDGPIATDSGGFQLYMYGNVDVTQKEIEEFQQQIGSDFAVILDTPPPLNFSYEKRKNAIIETNKRAELNKNHRFSDKTMWYGPVHGHQFKDLVKLSCDSINSLDFDVIAIGSSVQMFIKYMFLENATSIINVKKHIPSNKPIHLFGAGHPMYFAVCAMLGCDLFDSAFYMLAAKDKRYLTELGTYKLELMDEFPCCCEVCSKYTPEQVLKMEDEERTRLLATHNLIVTMTELRRIREAIKRGELIELALSRLRAHPQLTEIVEDFKTFGKAMQPYDCSTKESAFFYTGIESTLRPEILNFKEKLYSNFKPFTKKTLYILPDPFYTPFAYSESHRKIKNALLNEYGSDNIAFATHSCVCGVVPEALENMYPVSQCVYPKNINAKDSEIETFKNAFSSHYKDIIVVNPDDFSDAPISAKPLYAESPLDIVRYCAEVQLGKGMRDIFSDECTVEFSKKTKRMRRVVDKDGLVATIRASDFFIIPKLRTVQKLPIKEKYLIVNDEVKEFVSTGKTVFSKFVKDCDKSILCEDQIFILDESKNCLGIGTAHLCGHEMLSFKRGTAAKVREGKK